MKGRLLMIFIFILLFIGTILIFGTALNTNVARSIPEKEVQQQLSLGQEGGVFTRSKLAEKYLDMPESERSMKDYYKNRAYPGAPPMITHPLISEKGIGGKNCLQCHQNGGYVNQFKAFAPVTPHPDWINCRQCHVPQKDNSLFENTDWEKPSPPTLGYQALSTSPVVMPHGIQYRENCLSCHAGPGAPKEIRVTHPERINCKQCHVPYQSAKSFSTPLESRNSTFVRNNFKTNEGGELNEKEQQEIKNWAEENKSN